MHTHTHTHTHTQVELEKLRVLDVNRKRMAEQRQAEILKNSAASYISYVKSLYADSSECVLANRPSSPGTPRAIWDQYQNQVHNI